jgi:hypothetical protein
MPSSTSSTARAGDGHGALLPRPRPRRRRQRVEQVHQAAEVRPRHRSAARRARGAAQALRHELARRDSKGHGRLLLWQERLREGRTVELLRLIGEAGSRWHQIKSPVPRDPWRRSRPTPPTCLRSRDAPASNRVAMAAHHAHRSPTAVHTRAPALPPHCASVPPPTARCPRPGLPLTTSARICTPACPCP